LELVQSVLIFGSTIQHALFFTVIIHLDCDCMHSSSYLLAASFASSQPWFRPSSFHHHGLHHFWISHRSMRFLSSCCLSSSSAFRYHPSLLPIIFISLHHVHGVWITICMFTMNSVINSGLLTMASKLQSLISIFELLLSVFLVATV
jgi:hypothetical protein